MSLVYLLVPDLFPGDGVGNDVLGMRAALEQFGHSPVYVCNRANHGIAHILPERLAELQDREAQDQNILIYHYAVEWPAGDRLFDQHRGPRILRYHNVTPPELLRPWNRDVADFCARGRYRVGNLRPGFLLLSDSAANEADYIASGGPSVPGLILPPFHRCETLVAAQPDPRVGNQVQASSGPRFLFVGRISPHKNVAALINDLDLALTQLYGDRLHERHFPDPHPVSFMERLTSRFYSSLRVADGPALYIVGSFAPHFRKYNRLVRSSAHRTRLLRVRFISNLSESGLAALYRGCDLFVTRSLHEGFCVPVAEALACGLPMMLPDEPVFHESSLEQAFFSKGLVAESLGRALQQNRTRSEDRSELTQIFVQKYGRPAMQDQLENAIRMARQIFESK